MSPQGKKSTAGDRTLDYLASHPEGATDREVKEALGLPGHSQANTTCRNLEKRARVVRVKGDDGLIRNVPATSHEGASGRPSSWETAGQVASALPDAIQLGQDLVGLIKGLFPPPKAETGEGTGEVTPADAGDDEPPNSPNRPWHWEGNVQAAVVKQLTRAQYEIIRAADTASHEHGHDIEARGPAGRLWVTVKGYPDGTERTPPDTQARHWFKDALYDIVEWHGGDSAIRLAIALPDFPIYRKMAERVSWLQEAAQFEFVWVRRWGRVDLPRAITGKNR